MAAGVITTGSAPKSLWPGIYAWFGQSYAPHGEECRELFDTHDSEKSYEEVVEVVAFGLAPEKEQGTSVEYSSWRQGDIDRYTNIPYALGFIVTREEIADNLYEKLVMDRTQRLAFSMYTTKEIVAANVYNRAFNSSFTFGNGQTLISTTQPSDVGNQSNRLSTDADLSETALEDILIQISNAKDPAGLQIAIRGRSLHIPTAEQFNAQRIIGSVLQNDTANNAINAIPSMGLLPEGWKMNHYFTDTDAWFVRTNTPHGMKLFEREAVEYSEDNDFDTDNMKYKAYMRFVPGRDDWRGVYGTSGA